MKFAALLVAIALIPVAGLAGYALNPDSEPSFSAYVLSQGLRHVPGQDSDDWIAVAVTGPNKGGALDVFTALSGYPTHGDLERSAQGKVKYYELKCQNYSSGASKNLYSSPQVVRKCVSLQRTRKQAENYMLELIAPEPKS